MKHKNQQTSVQNLHYAKNKGKKSDSLASKADKHKLYAEAVQTPKNEVKHMFNLALEASGHRHPPPRLFREDFCGTAVLSRAWAEANVLNQSFGVDLDKNVVEYGQNLLDTEAGPEAERVKLVVGNVLHKLPGIPQVDLIAALNYGVCYFHARKDLITYLKLSLENLLPNGVLIVDIFGGSSAYLPQTHQYRKSNFTYQFRQSRHDPLTNITEMHLDFIFSDKSILSSAFSYEFRVYSITEIKEAMEEVGFQKVKVWIGEEDDSEDSDDSSNSSDLEKSFTKLHVTNYIPIEKIKDTMKGWNAYITGTKVVGD